jgi:hypothetical protein
MAPRVMKPGTPALVSNLMPCMSTVWNFMAGPQKVASSPCR